jgi:ABC-type proline/glycine betaine transport system permease subunit
VALFAFVSLAYLGLFGFWEKSMSTMALVITAVSICMLFGLPLGIWCAKSRRVEALFYPVLDAMQTLPTFVYLIPAIAFFSIGKTPGVIATVIFALPPMIKLTALGIRREACRWSSGSRPGSGMSGQDRAERGRALEVGVVMSIVVSSAIQLCVGY